MKTTIISMFVGIGFACLIFALYAPSSFEGMWEQTELVPVISDDVVNLINTERFRSIKVQKFSDNSEYLTIIVDCIKDACTYSQELAKANYYYTGDGYIVTKSDDGGIRVFAEGGFIGVELFEDSINEKTDDIKVALKI